MPSRELERLERARARERIVILTKSDGISKIFSTRVPSMRARRAVKMHRARARARERTHARVYRVRHYRSESRPRNRVDARTRRRRRSIYTLGECVCVISRARRCSTRRSRRDAAHPALSKYLNAKHAVSRVSLSNKMFADEIKGARRDTFFLRNY